MHLSLSGVASFNCLVGDSSLQSRQEVVSSSSADCAEMVESFCFSIVERCRSLRERPERTAHEEEGGLSQELTTLQVRLGLGTESY